MKKTMVLLFGLLFVFVLLIFSCVSIGKIDNDNNIENEINSLVFQISDYLIGRIQENTPVSLINISEKELDLANAILDRVSSELVNSNKLVVVARNNLKPVEMEQSFQLSNASEESLVRIGNFLGAQVVISCYIDRQSGKDRLFVQALDSSTGIKIADKSFELSFLSTSNFLVMASGRLPVIEKIDARAPTIQQLISQQPNDELWGIGVSSIVELNEIAIDRSNIDLARQILNLAAKELYNESYFKEKEAYYIIPELLFAVSRNSSVVRRFQTNDGSIWYISSYKINSAKEYFPTIKEYIDIIRSGGILFLE